MRSYISEDGVIPLKLALNMIVSSSTSGLLATLTYFWRNQDIKSESVKYVCNGLVAGMVSISASYGNIGQISAIIIGGVGGILFTQSKMIAERFEVDDPLDVSHSFGICGIWSLLAVGLFDQQVGVFSAGSFNQFGVQLIGVSAFTLWSGLLSFIFFFSLKKNDKMRVPELFEMIGIDFMSRQNNKQCLLNTDKLELAQKLQKQRDTEMLSNHAR